MDKFEQMAQMWGEMTPEEQKKGMEMEKGKSLCPKLYDLYQLCKEC